MAILHSFVVIGVMAGYIVGVITVTLFEKMLGWRFAFMLQGWFMILIGIGFIFTDNKCLDVFNTYKESERNGGGVGGVASRENTRGKSFSDATQNLQAISAPVSL
jgi:MFS family permease